MLALFHFFASFRVQFCGLLYCPHRSSCQSEKFSLLASCSPSWAAHMKSTALTQISVFSISKCTFQISSQNLRKPFLKFLESNLQNQFVCKYETEDTFNDLLLLLLLITFIECYSPLVSRLPALACDST